LSNHQQQIQTIMKTGFVFAGLMVMGIVTFGQGWSGRHHGSAMASRGVDKMKSELSLTDDQVAKVKAINDKFTKSFEELRKDTTITIAASRAKARKLIADQRSQVNGVLTPAQQTKWAEHKTWASHNRNHFDGKRGNRARHQGDEKKPDEKK
jgi:Spy/CpxP family protein refolding chaperone